MTLLKKTYRKLRITLYWIFNKYLFKEIQYGSYFKNPRLLTKQYISCGAFVVGGFGGVRIEGVFRKGFNHPIIILDDHVSIQQNLHLTCAERVFIGKNTAIAANVTITDIHHPYTDIDIPIENQPLEVKPVSIGSDCKIYNNAVILLGVSIGRHVTIGANSVVIHSLPDYCVAVGNPAKIIKRYNFETKKWEKTDSKGNFIKI